jgi:hypothetical protein
MSITIIMGLSRGWKRYKTMKQIPMDEGKTVHVVFKLPSRSLQQKGVGGGRRNAIPHG